MNHRRKKSCRETACASTTQVDVFVLSSLQFQFWGDIGVSYYVDPFRVHLPHFRCFTKTLDATETKTKMLLRKSDAINIGVSTADITRVHTTRKRNANPKKKTVCACVCCIAEDCCTGDVSPFCRNSYRDERKKRKKDKIKTNKKKKTRRGSGCGRILCGLARTRTTNETKQIGKRHS